MNSIAHTACTLDRYCSYIPVVSTIEAIVNLATRIFFICQRQKTVPNNQYIKQVLDKDMTRLVLLLIPGIGNIIIWSMDAREEKYRAIYKLLGLDTWQTSGNRDEACRRIVHCYKTRNTDLDLSFLGLSSLPKRALARLSFLTLLDCRRNPSIRDVPNCIFDLPEDCRVFMSWCGIPRDVRKIIEEGAGRSDYRGPDIFFEEEYMENEREDSLELLKRATLDPVLKRLDIRSLGIQEDLLKDWLRRIVRTQNFKSYKIKALLATRVLSILQCAMEHPGYRATLVPVLIEATETCVDRALLGLNTLELQKEFFFASNQSLNGLLRILKGAYIMNTLEKIARRVNQRLKARGIRVDELETYLALQLHFRKEFSLPIQTRYMEHAACLTDKDLQEARKIVKAQLAQTDNLIAFCLSQEFWKKKLEEEYQQEFEALVAPLYQQLEELSSLREGEYLESSNQLQAKYESVKAKFLEEKTRELLASCA